MILFATTLTSDVGTNGLGRMASHNWPSGSATVKAEGTSSGVTLYAKTTTAATYTIVPTEVPAPDRYRISNVRVVGVANSGVVPEIFIFGMPFIGGLAEGRVPINGRSLDICVVHDTQTDVGHGYINGRYVKTFTANTRIEIKTDAFGGTVSIRIANIAIHSSTDAKPREPFYAASIHLGTAHTYWDYTGITFYESVNKQDPTLASPNASTRVDGATLNVDTGAGKFLVEAAGRTEATADAVIKVQGKTLDIPPSQGAAPTLIVETPDQLTIVRVATAG